MIKKLIVLLSLLFIHVLISFSTSSLFARQAIHRGMEQLVRPIPAQDTEKEGKGGKEDPYFIAFLKQLRDKVDGWLKSLNERIEREDITRFEVRFLEILRSILEWVKEKLDAKIESSEEQRPKRREKGGFFRETRQRVFPCFEILDYHSRG